MNNIKSKYFTQKIKKEETLFQEKDSGVMRLII